MKSTNLTVGIIGGGNIGSAIAIALSQQPTFKVMVSNPHLVKISHLKKFGIATISDNCQLAQKSDVVVLAVKPNMIQAVLGEIKTHLNSGKMLISVAAGILISQLSQWSKHSKIIRSMPNTPVQVGSGFTAWISKNLNKQEKEIVKKIFAATGEELELKKETDIDKIGAITGCGPAYVFYFMEAMQGAAEKFGFTSKEAKSICLQTFMGSIKLAQSSPEDFAKLRANVTSKGGVTQAAIEVMEDGKVKASFQKAIVRAKKRTEELRKS